MNPEAREVLDRQRRCLLGFMTQRGPLLAPMAYWSDGQHLWMTTAAGSVKARRLRERPTCAIHVPAAGDGPGVTAAGEVRVFRPGDPVGLLFHGPALTGAMAALAVRNATSMLGYAQDAPSVPARWAPPNRVVLRVRLRDVEMVEPPQTGPGVAPPLPGVVPSDVRRILAGRRRVVLGAEDASGDVAVIPALWGAGYALTAPAGVDLAEGTRVAAVLDADPEGRPSVVVGLSLQGDVDAEGRLRPERATWWRGFRLESATVPPPAERGSSGIVLPD